MPRERTKLTEKQERILVQAQLMGLTTADMIRISNRLKAIERQQEAQREIDAVVQGMLWVKKDTGWQITDTGGKVYDITNRKEKNNGRRSWENYYTLAVDVTVNKPGTRFQTRTGKQREVYINSDYPLKLLPEKSKELFHFMKLIKAGRWDHL